MGTVNGEGAPVLILLTVVIFSTNIGEIAGSRFSVQNLATGRHLLQGDNTSEVLLRYLDGTVRVDPLDHFKKYRGGFNLTNKHYWSSTIFTGVYGYAIGVMWLMIGVVFGLYMLSVIFSGKPEKCRSLHKRSQCHKRYSLWPVLVAFIFTVLAIVAVGLLLGGSFNFHSRASTIEGVIMNTANNASETIYNTTEAMNDIKNSLELSNGSTDASGLIMSTMAKLDTEAARIQRQARKNRQLIDKGLKIVCIVTTVIICINLIAVIALSVSGFLRLQRLVYWLITLCWLLTVICWLLFGIYFFLDKFSSDTCTALENFQEDPYNNSLSSILPCVEILSAKSVLSDVSARIYDLVNEVNSNISNKLASQNTVYICNPFSPPPEYNYQPDKCPANAIRIGDIPKVLKIFTCSNSDDGNCVGGVNISPSHFKIVEAYTSSIQSLLNAYPGMENLIDCQSVKDAFSEILNKHCRPLKKSARMVWSTMVFLSVIMVFLVIIWTSKAIYEENFRHSNGLMKPQSASPNSPESEVITKKSQGSIQSGSI